MTITPTFQVTELVVDHVGLLAVADGIVYYLTPCCRASVKGVEFGVACRACYRPVKRTLAAAWMADNSAAWDVWARQWHAAEDALGPRNPELISKMVGIVRAIVKGGA